MSLLKNLNESNLKPPKIYTSLLTKNLYDLNPLMFFTLNQNGLITSVSKQGAKKLKYDVSELIGTDILHIFHPDDKKKVEKKIKNCLKDITSIKEGEFRKLTKDGKIIWVKENLVSDIDANKKQIISVFCEDITKQKKAELRLRKNLSELKRKNKLESTIRKITQDVHKSINLDDVFSNAVNTLNKNINNIEQVGLYIIEGKKAVLKASKNYPKSFFEKISIIEKPRGFTWKTLVDGKPRYVKNAQNDKYIGQAGKELGTKSYASVPIKFKNKTIGVININSLRFDAFDSNELNLLEITAKQIEVAINNARQAEALAEIRKCSKRKCCTIVQKKIDTNPLLILFLKVFTKVLN